MKKNRLTELTLEELHKEQKAVSKILKGSAIVALILCGIILYMIFNRHSSSLIAVIPACFVTMLPGIIKLGQVNAELKSRNSIHR